MGGLAGVEGLSCLCVLVLSVEEETNLSIGLGILGPGIRGCDPVPDLPRSWACRAGGSLTAIRTVSKFVVYIVGTCCAHGGLQGPTCGSLPSPEAPRRMGPSCLLTIHPSLAQCQGLLHQESFLDEVDSALLLVNSWSVASNRGQVACPDSQIPIQPPA